MSWTDRSTAGADAESGGSADPAGPVADPVVGLARELAAELAAAQASFGGIDPSVPLIIEVSAPAAPAATPVPVAPNGHDATPGRDATPAPGADAAPAAVQAPDPDQPVVADRVFAVMGSTAHVLVVVQRADGEGHEIAAGRAERLLDGAQQRLTQLEQRWSRFLPTSEISALNRAEGVALAVSADTLQLVSRCIHGWRATAGRFDPSVHDAMVRIGYDRSAELLPPAPDAGNGHAGNGHAGNGHANAANGHGDCSGRRSPGCADIDIDPAAGTVRFGPGVAIDPGGIGKGLAGDIVVAELLAAGAVGAMANLGGDTVVAGTPPRATGWQIGVADPHAPEGSPDALCAVVGLSVGAVATSTRLERTWQQDGTTRHHLVDPATGTPVAGDIDAVTVMASAGWWAEALAKACFVGGVEEARALLRAAGATGLIVHHDGRVEPFDGLDVYLR